MAHFFLSSTIFLTIVRKNTFQQQPTAFIWIPIEFEKKFADVGWNIFGSKLLIFFAKSEKFTRQNLELEYVTLNVDYKSMYVSIYYI